MAETDPWADLADDIRRAAAGAGQAEARVAGLEADLERHRDALRDLLDTCGDHLEDAVSREDAPECFAAIDEAREVLGTEIVAVSTAVLAETLDAEQAEVWQARAEKAEARVAELEEAVTNALDFLRQDYPHAARACLENARRAGAPDHA